MQKKECICILTVAHPIDDVRVYRRIALSLVEEFEVIWIGPNVYFFEELANDGINRILFRSKKGIIGRLYNNYRVMNIFLKQRKNTHYVYFPDPDIALFYTIFIKSKRIKKIFDIHEVYHKQLLSRRVKGVLYNILSKLVERIIKSVVRKTDLTIGVSTTVLNYYVSNNTTHLVIRSCISQNLANFRNNNFQKKDVFTIYHGKNHMSHGTLHVLDALRILKEKKIACKVLMIGQGFSDSEIFNAYVNKYDISSHIDLLEGLPFIENLNHMTQCHAGLIAYGRDLGVDSLPNRFFEYLALSLPVIVPDFSKEMVNIVEKESCGLVVNTENSIQLAENIEYLIKNPELLKEMGKQGRNAFIKSHNWEIEVKPLIKYIRNN